MRPAGPIEGFFAGYGFAVLQRSPTEVVIGTAGRPWRPRGRLVPFADAAPGMVRVATDLRAEPLPGGRSRLSTETRVAATDERSRRAFRRYWLLIGPWSGLVRRSWLRAAARSAGYPSAQT